MGGGDKARELSKVGENRVRAKAVDGTSSEVMAGVGQGQTGSKWGWEHPIRMGERSGLGICVINACVT